jgi:hypothetical protein
MKISLFWGTKKGCTPDNFDMFFGHFFFVILDILKIFCSNKHQIITDLLHYLDPIKSKYGFVKKMYLVRSATNIYASFPKLLCRNVVF